MNTPSTLEELKRELLMLKLARQAERTAEPVEIGILRTERGAALPLSWSQQRLWFLERLDPAAGAAYRIPARLRLRGRLDVDALRAALTRIVARHEVLRTRFVEQDGQPLQRIDPPAEFALPVRDLRALAGHEQASAVARCGVDEESAPFDLAQGPLIRGRLLRLADDEHVLLLTQHHIVSDGWSIGVLVEEVRALYTAFTQGRDDPLPPLAVQYVDYAQWQRGWLQGELLERQLAFWRSHLGGAPALLELPLDRPRLTQQSYAGATVPVRLPAALSEGLRQLARQHGATLFMTLLAGWSVLLARLSGQGEVVTGTPVANRQRGGVDKLIGYFANTLALRVSVEDDPTVVQLLAQVKGNTLDAFSHQDVPFEQVVEALKPPRSTSHSPVFQVMLTLNNTPARHLDVAGLTLESMEQDSTSAQFELSLALEERDGLVQGTLTYATALFDAATVTRFARYFETLLGGMVADPQRTVSRLPLVDRQELTQLAAFNATARTYPSRLVHELFEEQVGRDGAATALVCGDERVSYAELNARANRLAHHLRTLGIAPDERVAICVERSVEMVVGLLAILKAGGAYVPLEPDYPAERLAYMLADSAPRVLLTHSGLRDRLAATMPVLELDRLDAVLGGLPDTNPGHGDLRPDHLAYVIYTSGSTGQPKGAMNQHDGVVNRLLWAQETYRLTADDRVLQKTPMAFDVSVWEFFLPLLAGAQLVMARPQGHQDPRYLADVIEQAGITMLHFVPSMLQLFLPQADAGRCASLRRVLCSGEALPVALQQQFHRSLPDVELHNLYGPTEAAVDVTAWHCLPEHVGTSVPIGRPIANTAMYVLDPHGQPVPVGVAGELYIGGVQVARGYLNRPELTAGRFVTDPFSAVPGARMYKTGDVGRWLASGAIEYLGRNDFQVKLRGQRIELGEIEARLTACDGVREAVVIARGEGGDMRLVAYLVPQADAQLDATTLRAALAQQVAEYMIPSAFVLLDAFPLTPNGKLDRKALPAPDAAALATREYEAPQGPVEEAVAGIWQELLGVERVGRHDHFFELGGHSLLVIGMLERLRQQGWHGDVRGVFAAPTVAALAATLSGQAEPARSVPPNLIPADATAITPEMLPLVALTQQQIDTVVAAVPGGAANIQDIYPLAPLQTGILFHHLLGGEGDAYLMRSVVSFDTAARLDAFLAALQQVIDRHDILRSAVHWQGLPRPVQVVQRNAPLPVTALPVVDGTPAHDQLLAQADPRRLRLDLQRAPLLAAWTVQEPDTGVCHLALLTHHLVCDHVTLEIVIGEIGMLLAGRGDALPPTLPYRDFVAETLADDPAVHEAYFRAQLGDVEEPTAPFDLVDVRGDGRDVDEVRIDLDDEVAASIRALARRHGVSPAVLFHVAWALVVAHCSGRDEAVFGTVLSGRLQGTSGADRVLGMFINTLPVRIKLAGLQVGEAVDAVYAQLSELLEHEQAPLALAQRCSGIAAAVPLFTSLLNYRHSRGNLHDRQAIEAWAGITAAAAEERTNYPLTVSVDDLGQGFGITAQCAGVDPARVAALLAQAVTQFAQALRERPGIPLDRVDILPPAERHRLLLEFQGERRAYPSRLVHELFEEQVARDGAATALVCGDERVSYAELNARANRLAHHLRTLGIAPDERVAICVERSVEMVVGLLAILKAGGAYVPLEPDYPAERLAYMLADSAPRVLLTHSGLRDRLAATMPVLELDRLDAVLAGQPDTNPDHGDLRPDHLAYVIYTSGSTGQPKGAMNQHDGVVNRLLWAQETYQLTADDRVLQKTPMAFDVSVWEFFLPLLAGAQLVMARPQGHQDPRYLADAIEQAGITMLHFVPSMLQLFLPQADAGRCASLRRVLCSGEALPVALQQQFHRSLPDVELHNLYGPTEAAVDVTAWHCLPEHEGTSVPIGRPIANTAMYVLDPHGQPVPVGVAGELYIGGVQVARGYLNRPELTAGRFVTDPFSAVPGARMYKTGDVGRWLDNGAIEYLGRNDFQVKLRGQRIELGEIEARLAACDGVREAVVVARGEGGDMRLVAYLVPQADAQLDATTLRAALAQQVAEYMIPSAFVVLDAFPLTPNGKLDRKALPAPDAAALATREYEAPQGPVEEAVAAIWQELLGVERVGRHDHFFELGGHSLLVIGMLERLRQQGWHGDVRGVFAAPTVAALAATLSGQAEPARSVPPNLIPADATAITPEMLPLVALTQQQIDTVVAAVPGGAANIQDIYPLAPLQAGILFHHLLGGEGDAYLMRSVVSFDTAARLDAFLAALQQVIDRHDILRSAVHWQGLPRPVQVVQRNAPLPVTALPVVDGTPAHDQLLAQADPRRLRLDLQRAPLLAAWTVQEPDTGVCHLALLTHHLVCDHVTLEIVIGEIGMLLAGRGDALPSTLPYRDFVAETLADDPAVHEAYFRAQLGDVEEPTAPFDLVDVRGDGRDVDEVRIDLDDEVAASIRKLARRHGVSPAVLFHVAWALVVAHCSGRDEAVFGTVLSGRLQGTSGADRVLGMFINTLPVRIKLAGLQVGEAVDAVYAQLSELLEHEQAPLALAQRCSGIAAAVPLFTSLLNYRHSRGNLHDRQAIEAWAGITAAAAEERTNYPLTVSVDDLGQGFGITAQCAGVDPARVAALLAQAVTQFAQALRERPDLPLDRVDILPPAERHRLLVEFQGERRAYPSRLVHELFEEQVGRDGAATALVCGDERMSYGELNARANQVAHYLRAAGVGADDLVGLYLERSCALIVGMLGILKAGAGYLPLDPINPHDRIAFMLADAQPKLVLTQATLAGALDGVPHLALDTDWQEVAGHPATDPQVAVDPAHLAYVIYTSGSTGRPKGVQIEHGNVQRLFAATQPWFDFGPEDTWTMFHSFAFDFSVWEIWGALVHGGKLVIVQREEAQSPQLFHALLARERVTVLNQTPSAFQQLIAVDAVAGSELALRKVIFGGEALNPAALAPWFAAHGDSMPQLINMYGITETTVHVTYEPLRQACVTAGATIGRPIPDLTVHVLDAHMNPAPIGVAGEMYVGGAGVARGYLNRPELTAERFIVQRFGDGQPQRLYRSGDRARRLADGRLEYLGRLDAQVKIRGYRIELGEIEARLVGCAGGGEAVVLARGEGGDKRLVAYVVPRPGAQLDAAALRAALAQQVAEYMIPSAFVVLDAFPLTPNGKLDRKALPAPDAAALARREYEAPQGAVEEAIAAIWQELLGVERVGRHDHFFELGGHSLLAIHLLARLRQQLGVDLAMRPLFAAPTLAALAALAQQSGPAAREVIPRAERSLPLPLSWAQQRLWFLDRMDPAASAAYHMPARLRLRGRLDVDALRAALTRIVARHEVLRTRFVEQDGMPLQRIDAPAEFALPVRDLTALAGHEQASAALRHSVDEASAPFDLAQGPLIRGQLLRLGDDEHVLLLTQHHIVSDGWSVGVLVEEVRTLYTAFTQGLDDPLPPLPVQYADYAQWQRGWLQGEPLERQLAFWRAHLGGAPALLELPLDRPRPAQQSYAGAALPVRLPAALSDGLRDLARQHGTTLFMTLLAGWSVLLARLSGQTEVVTGTPVANRQRGGVDQLIGFFVNTLALRVSVEDDPTVAQLLAQVKDSTLDAYSHQDVPFEQVVEALKPPRSTSHSPIFQVMLSLNNTPARTLELAGLTLESLAQDSASAQFELSLALEERDGMVQGALTYASALFDAPTVARFVGYFETLLAAMVADPRQTVSRLPLLDQQGLAQLAAFNATPGAYPSRLVHELFEEQVARDGAATALVCGDQRMSYGELNARANQVAHYLRAAGVGADDLVGLYLERSCALIVGMLGILKAGAGYLPLDPINPHDRIAFMLADAQPELVLTQATLAGALDGVPHLALDTDWQEVAGHPATDPQVAVDPAHLAYVIYTSGSTGRPKGVQIEHGNVQRLFAATQPWFDFGPEDTWTMFHSFAFDFSVWEIWGALVYGGKLVIVQRDEAQSPQLFHALLARERVTVLNQTPSAFQQLIAVDAAARSELALRKVIFGGEALNPAALAPWFAAHGDSMPQLINMYGITETTVHVTYEPLRQACVTAGATIGRPIPDLTVHVLDAHMNPAPIGVAGEMYVGGAGVARGYLNRPELTAERFIVQRFGDGQPQRLYRSGDRARRLADGRLEYLGRLDAQVKIRGYRIELGEIEARLVGCAGVGEAVVLARGDGGDKRLVAYLVPRPGAQLDAAALRAALAQQLAEYMIPSAFVVLDAFPLTPNGKLDRKALPAPDAAALAVREYEPPQGDVEEAVAAIWQDLLGVERVGRYDHFFELGGHSLMVIGMLERLRRQGWHGDVRSVFAAPTLAALAATLSRQAHVPDAVPPNRIPADATAITPEMLPLVALTQQQIDAVAAAVPGGVANIQDIYPLAPVQAGILFHHLLGGEGDAYLMRSVLRFDTAARLQDFLRALQQVIDRHDILRSAVYWQGLPQPVQVVHRAAPLGITRVDAGAGALERLLDSTDPRRMRLDLQCAPLLRVGTAYDAPSGKHYLVLLNHHLVSDHVTMELLIGEIGVLLQGRGGALPPVRPYRDFIAQTLQDDPAAQEAYFRRTLGDVDEPTAPFGLRDVQGSGKDVRVARQVLEEGVAARLRDVARRNGVTPAVLFHVAWALVLRQCSGRDDVVFGTVLSGRMRGTEGSSATLGMFINTLPVRIRLDGTSVAAAIATTYRELGELLKHEQAPLAMAQRCSGVTAPAPLFTTLLNFRHSTQLAANQQVAEWEGIHLLPAEERTNYPIDVSVDDTGTGFVLEACTVGITPQRIVGYLHAALGQLLAALEAAPDTPVQALDILPPEERAALLDAYPLVRAADMLAHRLVERQARARPDAPAVVAPDAVLSYAELNRQANRLAHHLIGLGVRPDSRVGLALERSPASIVAMLAILKAGGAFVPLDPNFPPARLAHMVADSAPVAVVTRQGLAGGLPLQGTAAVLVDSDAGRIAACRAHDPDPAAAGLGARHLAYVIYTSGSTGLPKGVMVEHGNLCNYIAGAMQLFASAASDVVLHQNTLNFDLSVEEIFPALASGAAVMPTESLFGADLAPGAAVRPTVVHLTSAHWHNLVGHWLAAPHLAVEQLNGVRLVNVTGDALSPRKIVDWETIRPAGVRLVNTYGPTEATVSCTATYVSADDPRSMASIGTPMLGARIYILNPQGQLLPAGATGEIHIGGHGIARGYLNRDDLNASRFVADPFSAQPGARMYRTGDLGRWGEDGALYFQGRSDFQVKVRGFRIELEEVESALLRCEGVRDAVVVARQDGDGGKYLAAYLVPTEGATLAVAALRPQLLAHLAEYMVPSAFVVLAALPLTPNGKLDRKALPAPDDDARAAAPAEPPCGDTETQLAGIWQQLLGVQRVGRHDDFFGLGGHSLLAIQLLARVREQFGVALELKTLFQVPTLAGLAEQIGALQLAALSDDDMAELLRDLESLDENELEAILTKERERLSNV